VEIGKIQDLIIDPAVGLIKNLIIAMGGTFSRKHIMITKEDIAEIGDYMILNLSKEQVEQIAVD